MKAQRARQAASVDTPGSVMVGSRPRMLARRKDRPESERRCEACYRPILEGVVSRGNSEYCSFECASSAVIPGRYLG